MSVAMENANNVQDEILRLNIAKSCKIEVKAKPSLATQVQFSDGCSPFECQSVKVGVLRQVAYVISQDNLSFCDIQIHSCVGSVPLHQPLFDHPLPRYPPITQAGTLSVTRQVESYLPPVLQRLVGPKLHLFTGTFSTSVLFSVDGI
jgi:hypothetical protein